MMIVIVTMNGEGSTGDQEEWIPTSDDDLSYGLALSSTGGGKNPLIPRSHHMITHLRLLMIESWNSEMNSL